MAAATVPEIWKQALDDNGDPVPGALLYSYVSETSTPLPLYADSELTTPLSNPTEADAGGFFPVMWMLPTGYSFTLKDSDGVTLHTADNIVDVGAQFAENYGEIMAEGSRSVTSGYTVTASDQTVTVASSGATVVNLPAASTRTKDITLKNMAGGTVVATCNGSDVVDGSLSTFTIAAASTPTFPAVTFRPVTGGWLIVASHP